MYAVITRSPEDGTFVDEFDDLTTAEKFAAELSAEGCTCTICKQLRTVEAQQPEDENAGIFAPSTMHRPLAVAQVA